MAEKFNREPLLGTLQNQLAILLGDAASIDAKALGLLAADVAILIFTGQASLQLGWWQWVVLLVPFFGSLAFAIAGLYPQGYLPAAIDLDDRPDYLEMDEDMLVLQLISDSQDAVAHNAQLNVQRWRFCFLSFMLAVVGGLVLLLILGVK